MISHVVVCLIIPDSTVKCQLLVIETLEKSISERRERQLYSVSSALNSLHYREGLLTTHLFRSLRLQ